MKSIIQPEKKCFLTGRTDNLQEHHIFFGAKNLPQFEAVNFHIHDRFNTFGIVLRDSVDKYGYSFYRIEPSGLVFSAPRPGN